VSARHHRTWDEPQALDRMDAARQRHLMKRVVNEAEASAEYAAWRQQVELESELRFGPEEEPDAAELEEIERSKQDREHERAYWQAAQDEWLLFLDGTGLI